MSMSSLQAKQQCRAAMPSDPHGEWWSYRLIDGRKCWYEGKPMLSKSLLEWSKQASTKPESRVALASAGSDKPGNPMNAQARAPSDIDSFDARWRSRVEQAIVEELAANADKARHPIDRRL
jgi:hypothetical protein